MLKLLCDLFNMNCSSQDGPQFMAEEAKLFNYPFPYLYDEVFSILLSISTFNLQFVCNHICKCLFVCIFLASLFGLILLNCCILVHPHLEPLSNWTWHKTSYCNIQVIPPPSSFFILLQNFFFFYFDINLSVGNWTSCFL